ncbi:MAG: bifunctional phosphopantothenoylcysteine decarboxylase/phosphopantothenate--cysteine ligase CoaBC [Gammaproteobacteria bacterium]
MQLSGKHILLGVTGGIAVYKCPDLVRRLREAGADVQVVMSQSAQRFVTPLTFQAVSGHPVRTQLWDTSAEFAMGHIELARWVDLVLVTPATAGFMARLAHGHADDLLTTLCLATESPIVITPAMNWVMWENAATQENVRRLAKRGVRLLGPVAGELAEGETGMGRMLEPAEIVVALKDESSVSLKGLRVLVTAGPTREPIDPVRYMSNRSSGKMGYAVARAAAEAGAIVTLVSGPTHLATPRDVRRVEIETAAEMHAAVMAEVARMDIFIAAAAVADYTPTDAAQQKIKKRGDDLELKLAKTTDILAEVAAHVPRPFTVGFAAETEKLEINAKAKLKNKRLDLIAANWVGNGRGFDRDDNALTVFWEDGAAELGRGPKLELARKLIRLIAERYPLYK